MSVRRKLAISAMFLVGFLWVLRSSLKIHPDKVTDDIAARLVLVLLAWLHILSHLTVSLHETTKGTSKANDQSYR